MCRLVVNILVSVAITGLVCGQQVDASGACQDEKKKIEEKHNGQLPPGTFVPRCHPDTGKYKQTQCHDSTGFCWCVNVETGVKVPDTDVPPGTGPPNCDAQAVGEEAACGLPPKTGPCRASIPRFFFNSTSRKCETFTYGGCEGNKNNFESERECRNVCQGESSQNCRAEKRKIEEQHNGLPPPGAYVPQCHPETGKYTSIQCHFSTGYCWCANVETGVKLPDTDVPPSRGRPDCDTEAADAERAARVKICYLPKLSGQCKDQEQVVTSAEKRFFYNKEATVCMQFDYYGCEESSNDNNFRTLADCVRTCREADPPTCFFDGEVTPVKGGHDCDTAQCPEGTHCILTHGGQNTTCCNSTIEKLSAKLFEADCREGSAKLRETVGNVPEPFVAESCASNFCPEHFDCDEVLPSKLARCCAKVQPPSCEGPRDVGSCTSLPKNQRYYWDSKKSLCLAMSYSGCGGNGNSYASVAECLGRCRPSDQNVCFGETKAATVVKNRPEDQATCFNSNVTCPEGFQCQQGMADPVCCDIKSQNVKQAIWSRTCPDGRTSVWDQKAGQPLVAESCEQLRCPDGSGCQPVHGHALCCVVRYETSLDSVSVVQETVVKPVDEEPLCETDVDVGLLCEADKENKDEKKRPKTAKKPSNRWFYSREKQMCLSFRYLGCGGNRNNFNSHRECSGRCFVYDGGPCNGNSTRAIAKNVTTTTTAPSNSSSTPVRPPLPPQNGGCISPAFDCPEAYVCKQGFTPFGSCCYEETERLYDEPYNISTCGADKVPYRIWNGQYYVAMLGEKCEQMQCPVGFECQQVNNLFARCCGKPAPPSKPEVDNYDSYPPKCQTPCEENCYPHFTKAGCPVCHCPEKKLELNKWQQSPCEATADCPNYCDMEQNQETKCWECTCSPDDRNAVFTVRFPLHVEAVNAPVFACMDFDLFSEYTIFNSSKDGLLFLKPRVVNRGNRMFVTADIRAELTNRNRSVSVRTQYQQSCSCEDYDDPFEVTSLDEPASWEMTGGDIGRARDLLSTSLVRKVTREKVGEGEELPQTVYIFIEVLERHSSNSTAAPAGLIGKWVPAQLAERFESWYSERYQCYRFTRREFFEVADNPIEGDDDTLL